LLRRGWGAALTLLFVAACQGPAGTPPTIHTFTASPETVRPGDPSTLSWHVTGASTLTLAPGVGSVLGQLAAVVTPATTTTYTLTATSAAGSDVDTVTVTIDDTFGVEGRVIGVHGQPLVGATVAIADLAPQTTDADGRFLVVGVEPPYRAIVRHPTEPYAIVYLGLTLAAPTLVHPGGVPLPDREATVTGTVSATTFPEPHGYKTLVTFGSPEVQASRTVDPFGGGFQFPGPVLRWWGPRVTVGALHALQWQFDTNGLPVGYSGHGQRPLTLDASEPDNPGQDMALLAVSPASLSGAVVVPPGHTLYERRLATVFPEGGHLVLATESAPAADFDYVTPVIDGATMAVAALGYRSSAVEYSYAVRAELPPHATGVSVHLPHVPLLMWPADAAVWIDFETSFGWEAPSAGVAAFVIAGDPSAVVLTGATSAVLPDLDAVGLPWTPGATYSWQVLGLAGFATVDETAVHTDGYLSSWLYAPAYRPVRDGALGVSLQRSFTLAP
jgi:hypothetical protein